MVHREWKLLVLSAQARDKNAQNFVWMSIMCGFGVSHIIIIDNINNSLTGDSNPFTRIST